MRRRGRPLADCEGLCLKGMASEWVTLSKWRTAPVRRGERELEGQYVARYGGLDAAFTPPGLTLNGSQGHALPGKPTTGGRGVQT
jgi:hypothetical protein